MKKLAKDIQAVSKAIKVLGKKLDTITTAVEKLSKPAAPKKAAKKAPKKAAKKAVKKVVKKKAVAKKTVAKKAAKKKTVKKAAPKKAAPKKAVAQKVTMKKGTDFAQVVDLIRRSKKGVTTTQIKTKTGFNDKKIANVIFKAKKKGLIKTEKKGLYIKG